MNRTMTPDKLRELDAWIETNLFGGVANRCNFEEGRKIVGCTYYKSDGSEVPHYSSRADAAMDVLKECHEYTSIIFGFHESPTGNSYYAGGIINPDAVNIFESAETLELAICLFAKRFFSK